MWFFLKMLHAFLWISLRSSHTAGRDVFNFWLGNDGYDFVRIGNLLCSRLCLCLLVCFAKGLRFLVEQPEGSSLSNHPRFQMILRIGTASWLNLKICIYVASTCAEDTESYWITPELTNCGHAGLYWLFLDGSFQWKYSKKASPLEQWPRTTSRNRERRWFCHVHVSVE